jgi:amino acid transporter
MVRRLSSKRRLPVLQQKEGDDSPPRPRWQWVAFGAISMIVVWVPLAYAAEALVVHLQASLREPLWTVPDATVGKVGAVMFVGPPASLVLAIFIGGYVLGRWGESKRGIDAASAAALAVAFGVGLTWAKSGIMWLALVALLLAVPVAVLGASLGRRRRGHLSTSRR